MCEKNDQIRWKMKVMRIAALTRLSFQIYATTPWTLLWVLQRIGRRWRRKKQRREGREEA